MTALERVVVCNHHYNSDTSTVSEHTGQEGHCEYCWKEYKRGFDEGYENGEDTGFTAGAAAQRKDDLASGKHFVDRLPGTSPLRNMLRKMGDETVDAIRSTPLCQLPTATEDRL